jgi:hypothetical protein
VPLIDGAVVGGSPVRGDVVAEPRAVRSTSRDDGWRSVAVVGARSPVAPCSPGLSLWGPWLRDS